MAMVTVIEIWYQRKDDSGKVIAEFNDFEQVKAYYEAQGGIEVSFTVAYKFKKV